MYVYAFMCCVWVCVYVCGYVGVCACVILNDFTPLQIANRMITYTLISDTSGGTFQVQTRQNIVSLYLLKRVVYESLVNQTFILMVTTPEV